MSLCGACRRPCGRVQEGARDCHRDGRSLLVCGCGCLDGVVGHLVRRASCRKRCMRKDAPSAWACPAHCSQGVRGNLSPTRSGAQHDRRGRRAVSCEDTCEEEKTGNADVERALSTIPLRDGMHAILSLLRHKVEVEKSARVFVASDANTEYIRMILSHHGHYDGLIEEVF
eukprot:PhM_4_TR18075/c2_g3_i1/m.66363